MLYPIHTESRSIIDLNGSWNSKLDNGNGLAENWYEEKLKDYNSERSHSDYLHLDFL
jgi:beta-glucuronidase